MLRSKCTVCLVPSLTPSLLLLPLLMPLLLLPLLLLLLPGLHASAVCCRGHDSVPLRGLPGSTAERQRKGAAHV
jgi:hypothetical protein